MAGHLPLWNKKDFSPPPCIKFLVDSGEILTSELESCRTVVNQTLQHLQDVQYWKSEEYVLTRLLYRSCNNLRGQKIIQGLKRMKKCISTFKDMNLGKLLTNFRTDLPSGDELHLKRVYLPSRQTAESVLVRLLGGGALLGQAINYCAHTFICAQQHLGTGKYVPNMLVFANLTSRIRALCILTMKELCASYNIIHQVSVLFQPAPVPWLAVGESLPSDMEKWLLSQGYNTSLNPIQEERNLQSSIELSHFLSKFAADVPSPGSAQGSVTDQESVDEQTESVDREDSEPVGSTISVDHPTESEISVTGNESDLIDVGVAVSRESLLSQSKVTDDIKGLGTARIKIPHKKVREVVRTDCVYDMEVLKSAITKCQSGKCLYREIKRSALKREAQQRGIKGFVKLKKAARELCVGKKLGDQKIGQVKIMAFKLLKKIKDHDDAGKCQDTEVGTKEATKSVPQSSRILDIPQSHIKQHFLNNITKMKHLRELRRDLERCDWTVYSDGKMCRVSVQAVKKVDDVIVKSMNMMKSGAEEKSAILAKAAKTLAVVFKAEINGKVSNLKSAKRQSEMKQLDATHVSEGGQMTEALWDSIKAIKSRRDALKVVGHVKPHMKQDLHRKLLTQIKMVFSDKSMKKTKKLKIVSRFLEMTLNSSASTNY